jgi:hypothetical protein
VRPSTVLRFGRSLMKLGYHFYRGFLHGARAELDGSLNAHNARHRVTAFSIMRLKCHYNFSSSILITARTRIKAKDQLADSIGSYRKAHLELLPKLRPSRRSSAVPRFKILRLLFNSEMSALLLVAVCGGWGADWVRKRHISLTVLYHIFALATLWSKCGVLL